MRSDQVANVQTQAGVKGKNPPRANLSIVFYEDGIKGSAKYEMYDSIGIKRTQRHKVANGSLAVVLNDLSKALAEMVASEDAARGLFDGKGEQ